MASEAQRAACKRYYERTKHDNRVIILRLNKKADADVIEALETSENKTAYVKKLIRADIER